MISRRQAGAFLTATGALLLAGAVIPMLYGAAMAHLALAQLAVPPVTGSRWDTARLAAYQRTLNVGFKPPLAILRIPRLGVTVPVLEGVSAFTLNRGVGHIPGTAMPGEGGNVGITGHRDGFFRPLKEIVRGDVIDLQRPSRAGEPNLQHRDRYRVRAIRIVPESDASVLNPANEDTLTLITCYPFYLVGPSPRRYIVQATRLGDTGSNL